jgi:hypothetical protein
MPIFKNSEPLSTCLVWKITSIPLPVVDRNNHLSKHFLSLFYKWKALEHAKSLLPSAKGTKFYFYVESSSSMFMHRLREHSCHSEYNVHSPKIYYWLIHDYGIAYSQIICYSHPLNFDGVLCIYVLLLHEGQAEYHFAIFSICSKQINTFQCIIIHDLLFVLPFML